jgi:hypothetical protein
VDVTDNTTHTSASGATTRNVVSPMGCGANSATIPHAHANQSNTAATRAVVVLQLSSASAIAPPADTGSNAHTTRAHHNEINARAPFRSAAFDRDDELCLSYESSCRGPSWLQE